MEDAFGLEVLVLEVVVAFAVHFHPANVLASPKAPLLQTLASFVQSIGRTAPQEEERPLRGHRSHVDVLELDKVGQ